jgi:hypothetical protein
MYGYWRSTRCTAEARVSTSAGNFWWCDNDIEQRVSQCLAHKPDIFEVLILHEQFQSKSCFMAFLNPGASPQSNYYDQALPFFRHFN